MTSGSGVQLEISATFPHGSLGSLDQRGGHAQDALGAQVISQPKPDRGRDPASGESRQLAGDGIDPRYAKRGGEQAEHDSVVAGRLPARDEFGVLAAVSAAAWAQRITTLAQSRRRLPGLACELDRSQSLVRGRQLEVDLAVPEDAR